jgi:hypothetical protein
MDDLTVMHIAKVCHEANKAWCEANGDFSQKHWDDAEKWQQESARLGVLFRLENQDAKEDAQHNAWMKDKLESGWVFGDVKDPAEKTHPCLVPFEKLPAHQQIKDRLFCAVVDAIAPKERPQKGNRVFTYGERAVGLDFNPSGSGEVFDCKTAFAAEIDRMNNIRNEAISPERKRLASIAITELQTAQMWAVKALTWGEL